MINLFDLSAGVASTNMLTDRACRDDSLARRSRQDVRRTVDPAKVYVEDKPGASNRRPSSNRSNASPTNMILAKEISEELELKKKPPSVVARLMGLEDDLPAQGAALHSAKRNLKKSRLNGDMAEPNRPLQPRDQYYSSNTIRDTHIGPKETVEFKDVYEVSEERFRTYHLQDQMFSKGAPSRSKTDIKMEIVRQKFMEAKRLATSDKFLNSKELQEALEVLSSNRDLFLKFLEEPNSNFLKQLAELQRMPTQSQTNRITVLKPNKSFEGEGRREIRAHRISDENEHVMSRTHCRSHSAEVTFSQPTRIVVLKPSPGKPSRTMAQLTPRAAPSQLSEQIDFYGGSEDEEYRPDALHRRDESLLSSVYSNGYGGDESSFSRSEVDYIYEGGNLSDSDSEVVSQVSQHSWDDNKRYSSPCSGSRFHRTSHSTESPVIREAKKRLSERWASVAYDGTNQEQVQLPRRSSTLGEMISLREATNDVNGIHSVSSTRPFHTDELTLQGTCLSKCREDEGNGPCSPNNLARSKSLPVSSSMFDNITPKVPSSNSEGCKTPKMVTRPDKGKSSFTGKVSSFFFLKSRRQSKEKISLSSASTDERVEFTCLGIMKPKADENIGPDESMSFFGEKDDNSITQTICSSKDIVSLEVPISSDCPTGDLDGLSSSGGLRRTRDEPSPTSVLDASFEDSNINDSESLGNIACSNGRDTLPSTAIELITRSFSWEDVRSPSPGSTKLAPLSNVDDDELECAAFVQKILSSAGLDDLQLGMVFSQWYLPDCPLDPRLCDKLLDRKEEAATSRERRSNQKLLFDCVNMALIEIGEDALLCISRWSQAHSTKWRETLSQVLGVVVPRHMRDWLYGLGKFALNDNDDAGTILERIVQQEVEGRGWMKSMRRELDEITMQLAWELLEELVEKVVDDLAICSLQQDILMAMSNL